MCLKAQTPVLSTLAEVVDGNEGSKVREWATDLTLALLLQGAEISKLATSDEETGYHVALHMCCLTGTQIVGKQEGEWLDHWPLNLNSQWFNICVTSNFPY